MKVSLLKLITVALFGLSLSVTAPAFAGQKHQGHGYNNGYGNHYKHGNRHYRSNHRSHNKAGHIIGGIIGGVILGSVIHNATRHHSSHTYTKTYSNYPPNYQRYYSYTPPVVVSSTPTATYRVLNGNECYLVNINQHGNEILTQVPNLNCGF